MRLFVSLTPPASVLAHLGEAIAPLREQEPRLRWAAPERVHVTLAFLGEVEPRRLPALCPRLGRAAGRIGPLRLHLRGGGRFGADVLYVRLGGDVGELARLAAACAGAARHAGLAMADRAFRPHLTLARSRSRSAGQAPDLRGLVERLADYDGPEWSAETVALVRSHLGPAPRHETLQTWRLGGGEV